MKTETDEGSLEAEMEFSSVQLPFSPPVILLHGGRFLAGRSNEFLLIFFHQHCVSPFGIYDIFLSSLILNCTVSAFQICPGELITDSSLVTITQHARVYMARSLVKLRSSLDWIHLPKMCLKTFDKEGYHLGLTLQMQRNNRVGIHHGELNSRLA